MFPVNLNSPINFGGSFVRLSLFSCEYRFELFLVIKGNKESSQRHEICSVRLKTKSAVNV